MEESLLRNGIMAHGKNRKYCLGESEYVRYKFHWHDYNR